MQARRAQVVDRQAYQTKLEFEWAEGEALYGLGSHEEGMFNLRGQHQYLYQQNMKVVVPVLVSTRGYGILLDSYSLMTFHDDAFGSYFWSEVDDELDYYFVYGPEFDQIVTELRRLTGRGADAAQVGFRLHAIQGTLRDAGGTDRGRAGIPRRENCRWTASCSTGSRGRATCGGRRPSIRSAFPIPDG